MPAVSDPGEASPLDMASAPEEGPGPPGWPGIAAALVGLVAVPAAVLPHLGLVAGPLLGLLALALGVVGLVRPARRRWPAVAGLVLAVLAIAGMRTSYHVAACQIDGDARTVAVVGEDGALAASWTHAGSGVLALDVWPAEEPPRRYLGTVGRGTFERGGALPLTAGPSYHLTGSMLERDGGATVPLELHVACS